MLSMHEDADGARVLATLGFDRLARGEAEAYDSASELVEMVGGTEAPP